MEDSLVSQCSEDKRPGADRKAGFPQMWLSITFTLTSKGGGVASYIYTNSTAR
jgi:hypothetical protein